MQPFLKKDCLFVKFYTFFNYLSKCRKIGVKSIVHLKIFFMKKIFTPLFSFTLLFIFLSLITTQLCAKGDFSYKKVKQFIPDGYQIYDTASGDFNSDGYTDFLIV